MSKISTLFAASLIIVSFCLPSSYGQSGQWPVTTRVDLSSGFGDYRQGRFHAGLDIRTSGRTGKRLLSPVDGYVYRLKMSYTGSGKALYIMGDDGFLYVFYHLGSFSEEIDKGVKSAQIRDQRYYIDEYLQPDSIRVAKSQFLGFTGQTGTGAPHLHFEVRTADNRPINPLTHGYQLGDKVRPTIEEIGFELLDDRSLFDDGHRTMFVPITSSSGGESTVPGVLYFNSPFGVLVNGFDEMRPDGMQQNIYKTTVELDGVPIYRSQYDSLDFDTDRAVFLEYDVVRAADNRTRTRRLYQRTGNEFSGSLSSGLGSGIIGGDELSFGPHKLTITATDCFDNQTRASVQFVWGPSEPIMQNDSAVTIADTLMEFYFTRSASYDQLGVDTVLVLRQVNEIWQRQSGVTVENLGNSQTRISIRDKTRRSHILAIAIHTASGAEHLENPFNGVIDKAGKGVDIKTSIENGGLIVSLNTIGRVGSPVRVLLYNDDKLIGTEAPSRFFSNKIYHVYIPPRPEYVSVDNIAIRWSENPAISSINDIDVQLAVFGLGDRTLEIDSLMSVRLGSDQLFEPQWIGFEKSTVAMKNRFQLDSDLYTILPKVFATRADFELECRMLRSSIMNEFSGLAWLDEKENRWVWLEDSEIIDRRVKATSMGGGMFAIVYDMVPPEISGMNLMAGRTVESAYPLVEFTVTDSLSGIGDDQSFDIRIDKNWLIPEYDPETGICRARPVEPLAPGDHHLAVIVRDRAGQTAEQYLIFNVAEKR